MDKKKERGNFLRFPGVRTVREALLDTYGPFARN